MIKNLIPKNLQNLSPYKPGKLIEEVRQELGLQNIIKLASNENNLGPSSHVINAISNSLKDLARYADADCREIKNKLGEKLNLSADHIIIGNGSSELILILAHAFLQPGLQALMSKPSFSLYATNSLAAGSEVVEIPLTKNYQHDLDKILEHANDKTALIFLDNPLNPTGAYIDPAKIEEFLTKIPKNSLLILDEAYADFARKPRPDYNYLLAKYPNLIILRTFSKIYGLAGLRVAYSLMNPELAQVINKIRQPFNVNSLAQVGVLAALEDDEHLQKTLVLTWEGLDYLKNGLDKLGLITYDSQANFLMFKTNQNADDIFNLLLKEGIIIRSLSSFGLAKHLRVTVGLQKENESFLKALSKVL